MDPYLMKNKESELETELEKMGAMQKPDAEIERANGTGVCT